MNKKRLIRKSHRYLGLFIGIQFLGWTISGLYFSWNDIDDVHGDHLRRSRKAIATDVNIVAPTVALNTLQQKTRIDSIHSINLISILGKPFYQIAYFSGHAGEGVHPHYHHALADGMTGDLRGPLTKEEATAVAVENVIEGAEVMKVQYLETVDEHHELRNGNFPAWAVQFKNPECTGYVSARLGTFQSVRHNQWRVFDFLWMLHTMDYQSRDNFNNWLLRAFSIFGLLTVVSGFLLFIVSSKRA